MKRIAAYFTLAIVAAGTACNPTYQAGSAGNTDDVYYTPGDDARQAASAPAPAQQAPSQGTRQDNYDRTNASGENGTVNNDDYYSPSSTTRTSDGSGNTYITNNYYNSDDYYDYAYSARLRRFYTPVYGYGYYDPFYTNSYWYDYNPVSWGVSIYLGYNWWAPSYFYYSPFAYPSWGFSFGWGYPSYGWGYPYYGYGYPYPYYGYGYPGYGYGYPGHCYGYGYGCGYGYNPCYYNSYDHYNNIYYGPRGSVSSTGSRSEPTRPERSVGHSYEMAVMGGKVAASNPELPGRLNASMRTEGASGTGKDALYPDTRPDKTPAGGRTENAAEQNDRTPRTETGNGDAKTRGGDTRDTQAAPGTRTTTAPDRPAEDRGKGETPDYRNDSRDRSGENNNDGKSRSSDGARPVYTQPDGKPETPARTKETPPGGRQENTRPSNEKPEQQSAPERSTPAPRQEQPRQQPQPQPQQRQPDNRQQNSPRQPRSDNRMYPDRGDAGQNERSAARQQRPTMKDYTSRPSNNNPSPGSRSFSGGSGGNKSSGGSFGGSSGGGRSSGGSFGGGGRSSSSGRR